MKRCPDCRRDYYDESLLYCLDDGAALLEGPAPSGENKTLLLNDVAAGTPTRLMESAAADSREGVKTRKGVFIILTAIVGLGLILAGYFYFGRSAGTDRISSIAVIPFVNATGNAELEYLSDGISENLIGTLGRVPNLSVKSRSAAFRYKGREKDVLAIGRELGVPAILTGRVIQQGQDITLYIELVDTVTENSLWQNIYNRRLTDLIALQSEVAWDVARRLGTHIAGADENRLAPTYTPHPEAYQLYMRGRFHTLRVTRPELLKAIPYLEKAIEIDPNYALAYVGLADAYRGLPLGGETDPQEYFPKAKEAAQKAVQIDENLAEAHAVLGWIIYWYDWDWESAEQHCRRALELDPGSADAHMALAHILSGLGRHEEAMTTARRGREIDPLNVRTNALEAQFLIYGGRSDEAIERLNKVLELDPDYWFAYQFMASALIEERRFDESVAAGEKGLAVYPENTRNLAFIAFALAKVGKTSEAKAMLAEMLSKHEKQFVPPFSIALVYHGLGEREETQRWLERGIVSRDPRMAFLYCEPKFQDLRGDPEFDALLRRMRFIK